MPGTDTRHWCWLVTEYQLKPGALGSWNTRIEVHRLLNIILKSNLTSISKIDSNLGTEGRYSTQYLESRIYILSKTHHQGRNNHGSEQESPLLDSVLRITPR